MPLDEFRRQFGYLVDYEPPPLIVDEAGEAHRKSGGDASCRSEHS
jgi:hypothetical protein